MVVELFFLFLLVGKEPEGTRAERGTGEGLVGCHGGQEVCCGFCEWDWRFSAVPGVDEACRAACFVFGGVCLEGRKEKRGACWAWEKPGLMGAAGARWRQGGRRRGGAFLFLWSKGRN